MKLIGFHTLSFAFAVLASFSCRFRCCLVGCSFALSFFGFLWLAFLLSASQFMRCLHLRHPSSLPTVIKMVITMFKLQRVGDTAHSVIAMNTYPLLAGSIRTHTANDGRPSPTFILYLMVYRNFSEFAHPPRSWRALLLDEDHLLLLNHFITLVVLNSTKHVFVVTDLLLAYPSQSAPGPLPTEAPFIDLNRTWPEDPWDKQFVVLPPGYTVIYIQGKIRAVGGVGSLELARESPQLNCNVAVGRNFMRLRGFRQLCIFKNPTRTVAIDYMCRCYPATTDGGPPNQLATSLSFATYHSPTSIGQYISMLEEGPTAACWESHLLIAPPGFGAGYNGNTLAYFTRYP